MKNHIYPLILSLLLLFGCAQQPVILVLRDTPQNPSFIVIPPNDFLNEVHFANGVEKSLIGSGAKVLRRPAGKTVENNTAADKNLLSNREISAQKLIVSESFRDIDEFTSDYLIETYADYRQVKCTNCKTKEIVSVFTVEEDSYSRDDLSQKMNNVQEFAKKIMNQAKLNQQSKPSKK